jgi:hypothetical protein
MLTITNPRQRVNYVQSGQLKLSSLQDASMLPPSKEDWSMANLDAYHFMSQFVQYMYYNSEK